MNERLANFNKYIFLQRPFIENILRKLPFRKPTPTPLDDTEQDYHIDPSSSEYLANIDTIPGELDEDYLIEPKRSSVLEFAANFGKDIIHLPAKPKGRVLIGVGVAAMLIGGAKIIYDHQRSKKRD